jgi:hypothetical protein
MARISDTSSYPLTTPAGSDYLIGTDVNDSDKTKTFSVDSLAAYVLGGGSALVVQDLILEGTTNTSTSQAIYGINIITTSTAADLATRLPEPVTGRSTVFINNSTISILVFPSTVGGEINGVVDGYAEIPPDGKAYTFYCTENPLPGAWTWSPPAVGQIQLPTIEVAHTNGVQTSAYGVGVPGFQLINPPGPNWYDDINITGSTALTFTPSIEYWRAETFNPAVNLVTTKVYSNFIAADGPNLPQIQRKVSYSNAGLGMNNYTASSVNLTGGSTVPAGPLSVPVEIGDVGTYYNIQPSNVVHIPPAETDLLGVGPHSSYYYTFIIVIPPTAATKTYKFDIFLEHS